MTGIITILSIAILALIVLNIILLVSNLRLRDTIFESKRDLERKQKEADDIKTWSIRQKESLFNVTPGDTGLIVDYKLQYGSGNEKVDFKVTYEVEILEISVNKFKVRAIDFTSTDSVGNELKNRQGILDLINVKSPWVDKSNVDMVVDDRKRRSDKLKDILGED